MIEYSIISGPIHESKEFELVTMDVEEPIVEDNKIVVFNDSWKEIVSSLGHWRWKAEFKILTDPNRKEMIACL